MAQNKTQATKRDVNEFLQSIEDAGKKEDSLRMNQLMQEITGAHPVMWGDSIVGYGDYHYKYASGREGDWFITGFSPRKQSLTIYLNYGFEENQELISKLGKHKIGKACLYIKKLSDVSEEVLRDLIKNTVEKMSGLQKENK